MYRTVKRLLDVSGAVVGLVFTAPVMLIILIVVRLTMGKPVLFRQRRPGLWEQPFTCLKFRTMNNQRDHNGALLSDERRLTRSGKLLRRTSLDELPQLVNILKGDLSFVGPRPLLEAYTPYYTDDERRRHSVRPGLTGWAQIHGRKQLTFEERFSYDIFYVEHIGFLLDMEILGRTLWSLVSQKTSTVIPEIPEVALNLLRSGSICPEKFINHNGEKK
ncbi:MAG TPA: sugar transferase [Edaphobacter sp.]|nr:sugar transferase [Edaphobacter sp.]